MRCFIGFESHQGEETHQTLPFFGAIDEFQIFSRALGAGEIAALGGLLPEVWAVGVPQQGGRSRRGAGPGRMM